MAVNSALWNARKSVVATAGDDFDGVDDVVASLSAFAAPVASVASVAAVVVFAAFAFFVDGLAAACDNGRRRLSAMRSRFCKVWRVTAGK
jgi:hypothetical protein